MAGGLRELEDSGDRLSEWLDPPGGAEGTGCHHLVAMGTAIFEGMEIN